MAEIRAFRGVRFGDAAGCGLGRLVAPPYDVSRPELVALLHERSPYNMVHLEHVRPDAGADPHALAATRYRQWLRGGVLRRDEVPALYRYDHTFTVDGRRLTRRGVFAAVRLAAWEERVVLPHEETFPAPVRERLRRLRAVRANLSPIYLLARDPDGEFRALLQALDAATPEFEATDPDGEEHRLAPIRDPAIVGRLRAVCAGRRLYVADGHHRYEAALAYRDERRAAASDSSSPAARGEPAHEYVLALISVADDPSVVILPTHRLVRTLPHLDPDGIRRALARHFDIEPLPAANGASSVEQFDMAAREPGTICVAVAHVTGQWEGWRLRSKPGAPHAALLPSDRSPAWRALPTATLEHVVLGQLLELTGERRTEHVAHIHDAALAVAAVERGDAEVAFLVRPSTIAELVAVADAGDRMPPKSTYFSPKVPAGLVIHDLT